MAPDRFRIVIRTVFRPVDSSESAGRRSAHGQPLRALTPRCLNARKTVRKARISYHISPGSNYIYTPHPLGLRDDSMAFSTSFAGVLRISIRAWTSSA